MPVGQGLVNVTISDYTNSSNQGVYSPSLDTLEIIILYECIYGCMDELACNYNIDATNDDGSCIFQTYYIDNIISCDSYEWNGEIYNESGTYEYLSQESENNYSMSFDGINDNVNLGVIELNSNMNISFDVFINENSFSHGVEIIGQNGFLGEDWFGIRYDQQYSQNNQNNTFTFRRYKEGYAYDVIIPFQMEAEVWTNISVNYSLENQFVHLYVNGEFVGSDNCSLEPLSNSNLEIGGNVADENSSLEGKIDNLTIWSTTLSEIEINNLKDCGTDVDEDNLIGYWNFEEGQGETIIDLSGNGNDGTINGASFSVDIPEQSCQLTYANNCDSIAVLNLTINQPDTSFIEITACDSYEWNGQTYTESGNYIYLVCFLAMYF